jgi:hypothetical protein
MARVTYVLGVHRRGSDPSDSDNRAPAREAPCEADAVLDLGLRREAIRRLAAGVRRDDVPAEDVGFEAEVAERGADDSRGRLRRARACQLALRRERDATHARTAVARRLPHEQQPCFRAGGEVGA